MNRILFIVSTLGKSGPTLQLSYINKNLDSKKFSSTIVTLSSEPRDSLISIFDELNVNIISLNSTRIEGVLFAKQKLKKLISQIEPDIIHTQGLRADWLLSRIKYDKPWFSTSRNFPPEDYPMKYGHIKGAVISFIHRRALSKCENLISCSHSINEQLNEIGIKSEVIQNGTEITPISKINLKPNNYEKPIFVTASNLIRRKNIKLLIDVFNHFFKDNKGTFLILGKGPEKESLESRINCENIKFLGQVGNVKDFLNTSDYFISASLAEGLPNAVLEALSTGLPIIFSDINPHKEIITKMPNSCILFELNNGNSSLLNVLSSLKDHRFQSKGSIIEQTKIYFGAKKMSLEYQSKYNNQISKQKQSLNKHLH